jgi:hypothetical protein
MSVWTLVAIVAIAVFAVYYFWRGSSAASGNVLPSGGVSGGTEISLPSGVLAAGTEQGQYSIQWWMLVSDWSTKYGAEKPVLSRKTVTGHVNPEVVLHPTDNKLVFRISYLPAVPEPDATPKDPATKKAVDTIISQAKAANKDVPDWLTSAQSALDYEEFTCELENIPLQSLFCIGLSLQQRSLDVYMNGRLAKTCILPGVPVGTAAIASVGQKGGFAGKIANMHFSTQPLTPDVALAFFQAGATVKDVPVNPSAANSWNPFKRYTFSFKLTDSATGKDIQDGSI